MSCVVPIDRIPQICQRRGRHDDAKLLSIRNELTLVHTLLAIFFAWMCYRMASTGRTNGKIRGKMNSLKPPPTKQESKRMLAPSGRYAGMQANPLPLGSDLWS